MTDLTPLQHALLTAATQRTDGSLLPPPEAVGAQITRLQKAAARLIVLGLANEQPVTSEASSWRAAEGVFYGVIITPAGREQVAALTPAEDGRAAAEIIGEPSPARRQSKADTVFDLLSRADGASVSDIMDATGWQPHTTRAVLTGLRKKGHTLGKTGDRGASRYRILAVEA